MRRSQTPSLTRRTTFEPVDQPTSFKKLDHHFGQVKTGNVNEKRNFWLRSTEKLHEMSPGPRRRRVQGQDWIRQQDQSVPARPGSSMGQVASDQANVRKSVSSWADLSKSKSSAAVLQQPEVKRSRPRSKERTPHEVFHQQQESNAQKSSINLSDAHTNQVQETVTKWGKTSTSAVGQQQQTAQIMRSAKSATPPPPPPTRHIGETFSESKVAKASQESNKATAAPWRTNKAPSNPEPSVKVVNVAVENSNNMRFSESAEAQMAKHLKQTSVEQHSSSSITTMTTSNTSSSTISEKVVVAQPPKSPGPSRKAPAAAAAATTPKGKSANASSSSVPLSRPATASKSASSTTEDCQPAQKPLDHTMLSSSSGQISMSSQQQQQQHFEQVITEQKWEQQEQFRQTSQTSSDHQSQITPVISGWIQAEEEQSKKPNKPARQQKPTEKEEMPPPPPPPIPPPQLPASVVETAADLNLLPSRPKEQGEEALEDPGEEARRQRAQELVQTALAGKVNQAKDHLSDDHKQRDAKVMEARAKMLQEVASLRSDAPAEEDEFNSTSQERAAERAKQERNRELAEIAEMRKCNWENIVSTTDNLQPRHTPSRTPDPDLEEARNTIRHAAARWQEREQSTQVRYGTPPSGRTTPSRRIGNLFKKGSDHWSMDDEDFPAPPTDIIEMEVTLPLPAPPPRDSSREVMMEYGKRRNS